MTPGEAAYNKWREGQARPPVEWSRLDEPGHLRWEQIAQAAIDANEPV